MLNLSGMVRLGKVYLSRNYKDCHDVKVFSQGPVKLPCAAHGNPRSISCTPVECTVQKLKNGHTETCSSNQKSQN